MNVASNDRFSRAFQARRRTRALLSILSVSLLLSGTASAAPAAAGLDVAGMDRAVAPGDDFFRYANGGWLRTTQIPPDRASWGVFAMLAEQTTAQLEPLIRDAPRAAPGSEARKVGDYFTAYLDEAAIERAGLTPLAPTLARIAALRDKRELAAELGRELRADVDALNSTDLYTGRLFGLWVEQDLNAPERYAPYLLQGGLGMPDREYYLSDSARMTAVRESYLKHLATVLRLAHAPDPEAQARRIFDLELKIARVHFSRADSGDVAKTNNPWTRADFDAKAPGLDWAAFFSAARLQAQPRFIVWQPSAVTGEAALVAGEPLSVWKEYLALRQIEQYADLLPRAFADERFAFYGTVLSGTPQQQPRWKRAITATNGALGDAVGKLYVAKFFPPASKAAVQAMVEDIKAAFARRIDALDWMTPATKAEAKRKVETLRVAVGYPDRWIDYAGLRIAPDEALANQMRAEDFEYGRALAKLGRPVDRGEWAMLAQTVNAVNLPVKNALNFPAAILQAPYFDPRNPPALNYGAIGAIIGHEISHSFDDTGSQFDATGRFRNWWTEADLARFKASSQALAAQYSLYRPFPDLALNGQQVLGESLADLAGLAAAYDAYRHASAGRRGASIDGFSEDQGFFIAFAQSWRDMSREPAMRQRVVTDGHAPPEFRADTVRNLDAWYAAFDVRPDQKLYLGPDARVRVW